MFVRLEMVWMLRSTNPLVADTTVNIAFLFIMLFLDPKLDSVIACVTLDETMGACLGGMRDEGRKSQAASGAVNEATRTGVDIMIFLGEKHH